MARAVWNGQTLAESEDYELVEGNVYFPPKALFRQFLRSSDTTTVCGWKGEARYYDVVVDGEVDRDAAWYYPAPKQAAEHIKDHVAFWRGVEVSR